MAARERPHMTTRDWIKYLNQQGVSNRTVPDRSDLIEPNYTDPEGIKEERNVLTGIVSIRAYQRAKILMLHHTDLLSSPRCKDIPQPQEEHILNKNIGITEVFKDAMTVALIQDEEIVRANPAHPAYSIYQRLDQIWILFCPTFR